MSEWRAYSSEDGESYGTVAYEDECTEEEALKRAIDLFGENVYVDLKSGF